MGCSAGFTRVSPHVGVCPMNKAVSFPSHQRCSFRGARMESLPPAAPCVLQTQLCPKHRGAKPDGETKLCCLRLSKGSFKPELLPVVGVQECEPQVGIHTVQLSHLHASCGMYSQVSRDHVQTISSRCLPSLP